MREVSGEMGQSLTVMLSADERGVLRHPWLSLTPCNEALTQTAIVRNETNTWRWGL